MRKARTFESYREYDAWFQTAGDITEIPVMIEDDWRITAELTTKCKNWKTAVNRLEKAFGANETVKAWIDGLKESGECGVFECHDDSGEYGVFGYSVEEVDNGEWYVYITATGAYADKERTEEAETTEEASEEPEQEETETEPTEEAAEIAETVTYTVEKCGKVVDTITGRYTMEQVVKEYKDQDTTITCAETGETVTTTGETERFNKIVAKWEEAARKAAETVAEVATDEREESTMKKSGAYEHELLKLANNRENREKHGGIFWNLETVVLILSGLALTAAAAIVYGLAVAVSWTAANVPTMISAAQKAAQKAIEAARAAAEIATDTFKAFSHMGRKAATVAKVAAAMIAMITR